MIYCRLLGFIPRFAILEQKVCLHTWGVTFRHLDLVDAVILLKNVLKVLLPVESHHWHIVFSKI